MKTFNLISTIIFSVIAVVTAISGFYNTFHFVICGASVLMALIALYDDTEGESIISKLKKSLQ